MARNRQSKREQDKDYRSNRNGRRVRHVDIGAESTTGLELERRICLSTLYSFDIVVKEGQLSLSSMGNGPSINDQGKIAFVGNYASGAQGLFIGDGLSPPTNINPDFSNDPNRTFGQAAEINNDGIVLAVDRDNSGGAQWRLRTWDSSQINSYIVYARASVSGVQPGDFDALSSFATLANDGGIAYSDLVGSQWELRYTTSPVGNGNVIATLPAPQSLRPAIADGGKIVARIGPSNSVTDPLLQNNSLPGTFFSFPIASGSTTPPFSGEGRAAGIDSSGKVVGFYGEDAQGPGIFVRVVTGPSIATIVRMAGISGNGFLDPGETFNDSNGNGKFDAGEIDSGPFKAFDPLARVGVNGNRVVFLATDSTDKKVLYSAQFSVLNDQATNATSVEPGDLNRIAQVGGTLNLSGTGLVSIQDLNINDPINATGQVAFWARTDQGEMIVRANELVRPVLLLPGIMGTLPKLDLFNDWLLHRGYDPQGLVLEPLAHSYDDLVQTLQNSGYVKGQNLFVANYDWRVAPGPQSDGAVDGHVSGLTGSSITDGVYQYGVDYLGYWLKQAVQTWNTLHPEVILDSVDIIAHSTGGLVARTYIESDAYNAAIPGVMGATTKLPKIANFVMVGVPNRGASKAFNALNDNWALGLDKADSAAYVVLSKLFKQAWLKLKSGETIFGPTPQDSFRYTDVFTGSQFDFKKFIQKYVPTIRSLNATYKFFNENGVLKDVNSDSEFSNDWLLDLNGGNDPNAFAASLLVKPTVIYSSTVETAAIVKSRTGSLFPTVYPFRNSLPETVDSDVTWYEDFAGAHGGDGTVPTESSATPFVSDPRFATYEFDGVSHQGLTGDPGVQRTILARLGRPFTTVLSSNLAVPINLKNGWMVIMGVDPVDALLVDDQGRRLGYTQSTGPLNEIPGSTYFGGADGFGILHGVGPVPSDLRLIGVGGAYTVFVDGYVYGDVKGMTDSGSLTSGQVKEITLDFNPPPPTVPTILGITLLDQPIAGQMRIAIDFSVPMRASTARDIGNYSVSLRNAEALHTVSAVYTDTGDQHRVVLLLEGPSPLPGGEYAVRVDGRMLRSEEDIPIAATADRVAALVIDRNAVVTVGSSESTNNIGVLASTSLGSSPPNSFVAIDLNGDGIVDIASANLGLSSSAISDKGAGQLVVLLGLSGGRFGEPMAYDLDPKFNAVKVRATDWDGDGNLDLIVTATKTYYYESFAESAYIFINDGNGNFVRATDTPIPLTTTNPNFQNPVAGSIEVADVLPSVPGPELVGYKQGISGFGGIPDQEAQIQIIGKDPFLGYNILMTVGLGRNFAPANFRFGDFNGDGRIDILVGGSQDPILLLATAVGFADPLDIAFDHLEPGDLEISDVNGDGVLDIVSMHEDYSNNADVHDGDIISVLLGDGKGGFTALAPDVIGRRGSRLVAISDFDGDGKQDLLLTESWSDGPNGQNGYNWPDVNGLSAWVWKGDGTGQFSQPTSQPMLVPGGDTFGQPGTVALADIDGDGKRDVLFGGERSGSIPALINDGHGMLVQSTSPPPNLGSNDMWGGYAGDELRSGLAVADLNLDGLPDYVKISRSLNRLEIFLGQGFDRFTQVYSADVGSGYGQINWIQIGDLNGDQVPDLVAGSSGNLAILTGRGDGTYSSPTSLNTYPYAVEDGRLVDINRDGKLDLVSSIASNSAYSYAVYFGDGNGHLIFNANTIFSRTPGSNLVVADFDGDGIYDILDGTGNLTLFHGKGNGTFVATITSQVNYATRLEFGDTNGDGHLDLVGFGVLNNFSSVFYSYLNDGTGHFVNGSSVGGPGRAYGIQLGDYNGDGNLDVAMAYSGLFVPDGTPSISIMAGDGRGNFALAKPIDVGGRIAHSIVTYNTDSSLLAGSVIIVGSSTFQFSSSNFTAGEANGQAIITVTRSGDLGLSASVSYSMAGVTATAGIDFTQVAGTLSFAPGVASLTFGVPILNDSLVEEAESIGLILTGPNGPGTSLGATSSATLSIIDDDAPSHPGVLQFSMAATTVGEAGGSVVVTVNRLDGSDGTVTVHYDLVSISVAGPANIAPASGTLTFAPGVTSAVITIPIINDTTIDGDETARVTISSPTGNASLGTPKTLDLKIADDDAPIGVHPGTLHFSSSAVPTGEAGGSVAITVVREGGSDGTVSINFATIGGTATSGSDFDVTSGTLTFGPGMVSRTILVPIRDDGLIEGDETFEITLSSPLGGATLGSPSTTTITILDDDHPPVLHPGTLQFQVTSSSVSESSGTVAITINRLAGSDGAVSIDYVVSPEMIAGSPNFVATSGTLSFSAGVTSQIIFVALVDDDKFDGSDTAILTLSNPTGGATIGVPSSTTLTIVDDDKLIPHPGEFQFSLGSTTIDEDKGYVVLTILRSHGSDGVVTVDVATSTGDAVPGVNYASFRQTVTFAAGETTKSVPITILHDGAFSADRSFVVTLSGPSAGATLGQLSNSSIVIHNIDPPPVVKAPLVTVGGVRMISDKRKNVTQVVVSLSGAVDPAKAASISGYRLATAGKKGSFDAKGFKLIKLRSAIYNSSSHTVTLTLVKPVKLSKTVQLRIDGSTSGLTDSLGRPIDGNRDGQAGGNAVALLGKRGVTINLYFPG